MCCLVELLYLCIIFLIRKKGFTAMNSAPPIEGHTADRFAPVRESFEGLLRSGDETGAALSIMYRGDPVVDLQGGWSDAARTKAWDGSTLVNTFSVSKPVIAVALLSLVHRGDIKLDDRVSRYWPEFAAEGKGETTVRQILSHQAGLPVFPRILPSESVEDWDLLASELASATPEWYPGSALGEHALTYGHLVGELIRRVDGRTPGDFLRDTVTIPWGLDMHLGVAVEDFDRIAELEFENDEWPEKVSGAPDSLWARALGNPIGSLDLRVLNGSTWRRSQIPAVNVHATAISLARLFQGLLEGGELDGIRIISADLAREMHQVQAHGYDKLLKAPRSWGLGVGIDVASKEWGMGGIGGCYAGVQPNLDYAVAYTTRRLHDHQRVNALIDAFEECL